MVPEIIASKFRDMIHCFLQSGKKSLKPERDLSVKSFWWQGKIVISRIAKNIQEQIIYTINT